MTLAFQTMANVVVVATAVSRLNSRLAVIETKLRYVERELKMLPHDTKL